MATATVATVAASRSRRRASCRSWPSSPWRPWRPGAASADAATFRRNPPAGGLMRGLAVAIALLALVPAAIGQDMHHHAEPPAIGTQAMLDVRDDVKAGDLQRLNAI